MTTPLNKMLLLVAAALLVVALLATRTAESASFPSLIVDGVSYQPYKAVGDGGTTLHYNTPDTNPSSASVPERQQVWTGNGSEHLPCPGGIHWISNKNVLTISHCLPYEATTTTSIATTTIPAPTTTTASSTTVPPATTTTAPSTSTVPPSVPPTTSSPTTSVPPSTPTTSVAPTTTICTTGVVEYNVCQPVGCCEEPSTTVPTTSVPSTTPTPTVPTPPEQPPTTTPTTPTPTLPQTGGETGWLIAAAIIMIGTGLMLLLKTRPSQK